VTIRFEKLKGVLPLAIRKRSKNCCASKKESVTPDIVTGRRLSKFAGAFIVLALGALMGAETLTVTVALVAAPI
jgi:hypothetical protein